MESLRQQIHNALWKEHFADDRISGVTKDECWLLTAQVMEKLINAGIVRKDRT